MVIKLREFFSQTQHVAREARYDVLLDHMSSRLKADAALLGKAGRGIGHTALHWAAAAGHLACSTWLLEQGTPVDVRNAGESTPLHSAAGSGQLEVVQELLRRGADAKAQDDSGVTPDDLAQSRGHATVAEAVRGGGGSDAAAAGAAGPAEGASMPAGSAAYAY